MSSRVVRARLDDSAERALSILMRDGHNESEAVRAALTETAARRRRRTALEDEVRRLAEDEDDTTERRAATDDMADAEAAWPE